MNCCASANTESNYHSWRTHGWSISAWYEPGNMANHQMKHSKISCLISTGLSGATQTFLISSLNSLTNPCYKPHHHHHHHRNNNNNSNNNSCKSGRTLGQVANRINFVFRINNENGFIRQWTSQTLLALERVRPCARHRMYTHQTLPCLLARASAKWLEFTFLI